MPPSSSATKRSDDDDYAPSSSGPPVEISDFELDIDEQLEPEIIEEQEVDNDNKEEEEEEYQEIEVEEEVDIEEVEVEEDDMIDSSKEANVKRNDIGQGMEFEGNDGQLGLCSTPGRSEIGLPYNSLIEGKC